MLLLLSLHAAAAAPVVVVVVVVDDENFRPKLFCVGHFILVRHVTLGALTANVIFPPVRGDDNPHV